MTKDLHTPDNESLIEFPCDFKLKAMGKKSDDFIDIVYDIAIKYAPETPRENISINKSSGQKFISVNVTIYATCIEQIHGIYGDLKKHPEVLMT
ncbi:Proposed lipoate regulatory protein YbeD, partial [hydrothermal vent metagenome]